MNPNTTDNLIRQVAQSMEEQAAAYVRLEAASAQLCGALVRGEPSVIDSLTRAGEGELLKMRARLVQIISTLTAFSEARAKATETTPLTPEVRSLFDAASTKLLRSAREFQRTRKRAAALTTSGSTFAAALIETCGIKPTTYSGPYARNAEGRPWA